VGGAWAGTRQVDEGLVPQRGGGAQKGSCVARCNARAASEANACRARDYLLLKSLHVGGGEVFAEGKAPGG
jgi:hypothetical protein